jgi:hypothetical protein
MAGCSSSSSPSPEPLTDAQWIGFKDGDGNWQQIEPEVTANSVPDGIYPKFYLGFEESSSGTFSVNAGTYDLIGTYSDDSSLKYPTHYARNNDITVAPGQNPPEEIDFASEDMLTGPYAITIPSTVQRTSAAFRSSSQSPFVRP